MLKILTEYVALTDEALVQVYAYRMSAHGWGMASPSGLRSRRNELVREGLVVEVDRLGRTSSGRKAIRWAAVRDANG